MRLLLVRDNYPYLQEIDLLIDLGVYSSQPHSMLIVSWLLFPFAYVYKWALIELSRNPSFQIQLREELTDHFSRGGDPTYDELTSGLPYLDAVVHEVLRMHPPAWETTRVVRNPSSPVF
jgi:hypothetical protein